MELINSKIKCSCKKDVTYPFGCKNSVSWFVSERVLIKIRRKQKLDPKIEVSEIVLEEYEGSKTYYKNMKKLQPK